MKCNQIVLSVLSVIRVCVFFLIRYKGVFVCLIYLLTHLFFLFEIFFILSGVLFLNLSFIGARCIAQ